MREVFDKGNPEWRWCEQRQSSEGDTCLHIWLQRLRLGTSTTYAKINEVSRELLVKAVSICRRWGYRVLYAGCDSVFIQGEDASREDYEELANISRLSLASP
ncbi:MAG: hypothetical protein ACPL07_02805 [Candidatus Bathyarchaeia archaeon]